MTRGRRQFEASISVSCRKIWAIFMTSRQKTESDVWFSFPKTNRNNCKNYCQFEVVLHGPIENRRSNFDCIVLQISVSFWSISKLRDYRLLVRFPNSEYRGDNSCAVRVWWTTTSEKPKEWQIDIVLSTNDVTTDTRRHLAIRTFHYKTHIVKELHLHWNDVYSDYG